MLRKRESFSLTALLFIALSVIFLQAPGQSHGFGISIDVAPNTLNIQSQGQVVTVHTNIAYSSVIGGSVTLNGLDIAWWKADNQGNFVAKFLMSEVKALADDELLEVPGEIELALEGYTTGGDTFTGTQTITVINVEPSGSGRK
ncbi:MAG TPA: hypothetical protein ENN79_05910 [Desulfobacteraceae bacterium]|nr:hypothetical protein [Desulfobacteraceae bacterium]